MDSQERQPSRLTKLYRTYLQDRNTRNFLECISEFYDEPALIRLTGAACVDTRRASALSLGFIGSYQANDALGKLLRDNDRNVRLIAEGSLKSVWTRDGSQEQRQELCAVLRLILSQHFGEAVRRSNILLEEYPHFVEARNQRAIALFALKMFEESIEDSRMVVELNSYHFGALVGMGHAHLQLCNVHEAIECFQQALVVNPNLDYVRRRIAELEQSLDIFDFLEDSIFENN